ncbi:MAG: MFS transporter [Saccharothrix sp.]|nr:MFS transporter [Saccharothrix sp.]
MHHRATAPLYAAGFVTAFGAHGIAAGLGNYTHTSLLTLGLLLAVYDGAEIVLKPVFGTLADRIGPRPVLLGGLLAFTLASAAFVVSGNPAAVGVARFAQGAAAAAFSPAASALVARLTPTTHHGRAFGGYGAWKGLGYTLGPVLGGVLIALGGFTALFAALALISLTVAIWAAFTVPTVAPLPKPRQTLKDLTRRLASPGFLRPTAALSATTAALAVGVGFLPVQAASWGPLVSGAAVSCMAAAAALIQPLVGKARDRGNLRDTTGMATGLLLAAAGYTIAATVPGPIALFTAAIAIGTGAGAATPLGFTALAAATKPEHLGQTMGSAEVGRELGDAGGPLLVGAIATATTLSGGLLTLTAVLTAAALTITFPKPR